MAEYGYGDDAMSDGGPRISIPRHELPNLRILANIAPGILQELSRALSEKPPSLNVDRLSVSAAEASGIEPNVAQTVMRLLWRWAMVQRRLDLNANDLLTCLTSSLDELPEDDWNDSDRRAWSQISGELQQMLSLDTAITSGAKAMELLIDQQLILCKSRVITDMRPVFDDLAENLDGIVPYHTLVLHCHEGSGKRDVYVALDINDVISLRQQLERAERKESMLRDSLRAAGIEVIDSSAKSDD